MAKDSTNQVMKEMVFDDNYDLKVDPSYKNLPWKYDPLEEVEPRYEEEVLQECLEVKEAYETIDLSLSKELTYTLIIDSYVLL